MVNDHWSSPAPFFNFAKNLSLCICVSTCYRVIKAIFLNFFGVVCLWRSDKATLWHSTDFQRDRKWPNGQKCWFPTKNVTMSNCWHDSPGHAMPEYQSFLYYLFPHISMCSHETCINHLSFNCSMKFSTKTSLPWILAMSWKSTTKCKAQVTLNWRHSVRIANRFDRCETLVVWN